MWFPIRLQQYKIIQFTGDTSAGQPAINLGQERRDYKLIVIEIKPMKNEDPEYLGSTWPSRSFRKEDDWNTIQVQEEMAKDNWIGFVAFFIRYLPDQQITPYEPYPRMTLNFLVQANTRLVQIQKHQFCADLREEYQIKHFLEYLQVLHPLTRDELLMIGFKAWNLYITNIHAKNYDLYHGFVQDDELVAQLIEKLIPQMKHLSGLLSQPIQLREFLYKLVRRLLAIYGLYSIYLIDDIEKNQQPSPSHIE